MAIRGKVNGLIHRDIDRRHSRKETSKLHPKVTAPNGEVDHIETILPVPAKVMKEPQHLEDEEELYAITGFVDQMTKLSGIWRIGFIFDATAQKKDYLLTLFNETDSVMLFTVQTSPTPLDKRLFEITTPLGRFLKGLRKGDPGEKAGLWAALTEDDVGILD